MIFNAYHVLFLIALVCMFLYEMASATQLRFKNKRWNAGIVPFLLICIILILFSGLVGDISSDHYQYIKIYNNINNMPFSSFFSFDYKISYVEKGFGLILWLVGRLINNPVGVFIVSAALIIIPIGYLAYRTENPCFFIVLYLAFGNYYDGFNVIRQVIVGGTLIISLKYLVEGKFWKFLLINLLFASIHISALFMLPFYYLLRSRPGIKTTIIHIFIVSILSIGFYRLLGSVDTLLFHNKYFSTGRINEDSSILQIVIPSVLFILNGFILYRFRTDKEAITCQYLFNTVKAADDNFDYYNSCNVLYNVLYNASFYWILFWFLSLKFVYLKRITYFFLPLVLYTLAEGILAQQNKDMRIVMKIFIVIMAIIYYFVFGQYFDNYILFNQ